MAKHFASLLMGFLFLGVSLGADTHGSELSSRMPLRVFHGHLRSCVSVSREYVGVCVETGALGASTLLSIPNQANKGCEILSREIENLKNGFNILAFSQGGIIARTILHKCTNINRYIRRMVFVGTPHLGIQKLPVFVSQMQKEEERKLRLFTTVVGIASRTVLGVSRIARIGPSNYYYGTGMTAFLRDFNDPIYDPLYANLEAIINIVSVDEKVVVPASSTSFGAQLDPQTRRLHRAENLPFFQEHSSGIGALYRSGRMANCVSAENHSDLTSAEKTKLYNLVLLSTTIGAQMVANFANAFGTCTGMRF